MRDIRSLLLLLLSTGFVATWVYHIYDKAQYSRMSGAAPASVDSTLITQGVRDSLQKAFNETLSQFDKRLDSTQNTTDSLQAVLQEKIREINRLRTEIGLVLKNPTSTTSQVREAREKMKELQERIDELRSDNSSLEAEKLSLSNRLDQMTSDVSNLEQNMRRLDEENKALKERIRQASLFSASALHLAAIDVKGEKEQETGLARRADKFVTSFILQNTLDQVMNAEVYVVITQPDGHVLQNSAWDSGMFETRAGDRKSFTRRVKFDYEKGEQKRLIFTLDAENPEKGKYGLQLWHQGVMIGETYRVLN